MTRYRVKIGRLYFLRWVESEYPLFVIDDSPGAIEEVPTYPKEMALKVVRELSAGELEEVGEQ